MKYAIASTVLTIVSAANPAFAGTRWPLWENYAAHFLSDEGRVIDHDAFDRTTSEGQSTRCSSR